MLDRTVVAQPPGGLEKARLEVVADRSSYAPGSAVRLAAKMTIEDGWHTNSHTPTFDYLIATALRVTPPTDWPRATIEYPAGEMKSFAFADQPISVYDGQIVIFAGLEVPASVERGQHPVEVELRYQACDDRSCLPPVTTRTTVPLRVAEQGESSADLAFARSDRPLKTTSRSLALMLVLGVLGGLILNAMPCVLPVLSLKLFGLVKSAGRGRAEVVVGSLATAVGILLSFWALALAAVVARAAGAAVGWGVQFQEPVFVALLAVIVMLFCLNLWGLFEIPLPARLGRLADSGPKQGIPGHLVTGLFATLMATPCSAPFLGTAVGFALSQQAATTLAVFTAIGIGMALPYLALAVAPSAAGWLPKPGPWMSQLRTMMGFLLAGAAVWLFYVLAAQMSRERLAFIELAMLALAMSTWLWQRAAARRTARTIALLAIVACIAVVLGLAAGSSRAAVTADPTDFDALIPWVTFDRQEAERLAEAGRLVFVDVTADWCFTCKVNERLVLETPEVAATFERFGVIPMKADWTNRSQPIADFLADHGRYGIPFYLLYRPASAPHLFAELLTKEGLIRVVTEAAAAAESPPEP